VRWCNGSSTVWPRTASLRRIRRAVPLIARVRSARIPRLRGGAALAVSTTPRTTLARTRSEDRLRVTSARGRTRVLGLRLRRTVEVHERGTAADRRCLKRADRRGPHECRYGGDAAGNAAITLGARRMAENRRSIADRQRAFVQLHETGCFLIPNPWDAGTARCPCTATRSRSGRRSCLKAVGSDSLPHESRTFT